MFLLHFDYVNVSSYLYVYTSVHSILPALTSTYSPHHRVHSKSFYLSRKINKIEAKTNTEKESEPL